MNLFTIVSRISTRIAPHRGGLRAPLLCAVLIGALLGGSLGAAQPPPGALSTQPGEVAESGTPFAASWTVQVVALRDYRDATTLVDALQALGLDAYTEFSMFRGEQFVRIRVGCFTSRAGASAMAQLLDRRITAEAVPQPRDRAAAPRPCSSRDVGFLKPPRWQQLAPDEAAFEVSIGGAQAVVFHDGGRWRVAQQGAELPARQSAASTTTSFSQGEIGGAPVVMADAAGGSRALCSGRLLAVVGDVAIAEQEDAVVACGYQPLRAGAGAR